MCPTCFQAGVSQRKIEIVETRRTMYDSVALAFAILPALLVWPMVVGAPAALWVVFRRWKSPGSIVPLTRVRYYLAALIALAEIAGMAVAVWAVAHVSRPVAR